MKFRHPYLADQFRGLHPALIDACKDFDIWSRAEGLPEPEITELNRTMREQGNIYTPIWLRLLKRLHGGASLSPREMAIAKRIDGKTEDQIRNLAEREFTWHFVGCAADFSVKQYTGKQKTQAVAYLKTRCARPMWDVVTIPHGTGPHLHIEYESFSHRRLYDPRPKAS
jgi:hypothetical protein